MIPTSHLINLIDAFKKGDQKKIDQSIKNVIAIAEKKKQYKLAKKLRSIYSLQGNAKDIEKSNFVSNFNSSNDSHEQGLFEIRKSNVTLKNVVLNGRNSLILKEIINSFQKKELLKKHGLLSDIRILLYGPPGTGKTLSAYALAGELNLPIVHVYLDSLISSYLGETGKNLKMIFQEATSRECVLFLDEFDAIAKHRDDKQELGELKRVVTVLLQNIDELSPNTILIAATNHEHLLDPAIWRRFNYQLNVDSLDKESRSALYEMNLKNKKLNFDLLATISEGLSGAIIKQIIEKALKKNILEKKSVDLEKVLIVEILVTLSSVKKISKDEKCANFIKAVKVLRKIDPKLYTYDYLEKITSVPSSTIHILNKK